MTRLEKVRTEKGLSKYALAQKAGLAQSTIGRIESGQTKAKEIRIGILYKLAKALDVEITDLIDFDLLE